MPNGEDKKLNFVAKVYDPVTKTYRPIYIAPDATNAIQGDVYLTDIVDDTKNAQDGMTAITPAGVKKEIDRLNRVIESSNPYLNATVGSTIKPIYLDSGTFKEIIGLDGSMITSGTISLERLPQGALERLVTVENKEGRLALTRDRIQTGDVVQQLDTKVMYVVVDDTKLDQEEGYVEFAAGLATKALEADHAGVSDKLGIVDVGDSSHPFYLEKGVPRPITKVANAVVADQLGTTTVGDEKHPIYIRDGIATQISKVANAEVSDKLGTANIGSAIIPIFLANGVATASTASVGNANDPMRLVDGTLTTITKVNASNRADRLVTNLAAEGQDLNNYFGDDYYNRTFYAGGGNSVANKPAGVGAFGLLVVRIAAGWTLQILQDQNTDDYYIRRGNNVATGWNAWRKGATVAAKLGEANVGDATHPIYLNGGTPTRIDTVAASHTLAMKTLTNDTINKTPGTFAFKGNSSDPAGNFPGKNADWVGVQFDAGNDTIQIVGNAGSIAVRQNDSGVNADGSTSFSAWRDLATKDGSTHAGIADKLGTSRQISLTGPVTGNTNFDGSANVSIATTVNEVTTADIDRMFAGTYSNTGTPKFVESAELKYFVDKMKAL